MMYAVLAKQALMAMGVKDPVVLAMVERALSGSFEVPTLESFAGDSFPIPEGAETLVISSAKPDGNYKLVLICEKKG